MLFNCFLTSELMFIHPVETRSVSMTPNKAKEAKQSGLKEESLVVWSHVKSQVVGFQLLSGILH